MPPDTPLHQLAEDSLQQLWSDSSFVDLIEKTRKKLLNKKKVEPFRFPDMYWD